MPRGLRVPRGSILAQHEAARPADIEPGCPAVTPAGSAVVPRTGEGGTNVARLAKELPSVQAQRRKLRRGVSWPTSGPVSRAFAGGPHSAGESHVAAISPSFPICNLLNEVGSFGPLGTDLALGIEAQAETKAS